MERGYAMNYAERSERLSKAIDYAVAMHRGQVRKGTHIPYIVHPMETMQILIAMHAEDDVLIAGVLHDVLEDTDASPEGIAALFGERVCHLVELHSEDKSKSWHERKQHTIDSLQYGEKEYRMLVMADKVSNLRAIARDYAALGDELWVRFNQGMRDQSWYYGAVQDALYDMQFDVAAAPIYWEMVALYKDVFVSYWYDAAEEIIYAISMHGEDYRLCKDTLEWEAKSGVLSDYAVRIPRWYAEQLEDTWVFLAEQQRAQEEAVLA